MTDSILTSIKKLLGLTDECKDFDTDIIIHINTVFSILRQLGVGPEEGYRIIDSSDTWDEFISDEEYLDDVKSYIYFKVKLLFDPPLSSAVMTSIKEVINELEWRLNVDADKQ